MSEGKYRNVLEKLKSEILGGKFSSKRSFPSIVSTCSRFGISRLTAVKVFDKLKAEGLISSRVGSGTFVTGAGRSRIVGLLVPGTVYASEFFQPIIAELIRLARLRDYILIADGVWSCKPIDNGREAVEVAARLIRRHVAGVIFQPLEHSPLSDACNRRILSAFARAKIPVVLIDGDIVAGPARSDYDLVSIDNVAAGEAVARHMMERGARAVRFLMRESWVENVKNRIRGVENAVRLGGLRWNKGSVLTFEPFDAGAVARLMRGRPRPDAIICENDVIAASLMKTLGSLGFGVPGDVMVSGFDDIRIARLANPGITSIHQPSEDLAQAAFDRLVARMAGETMAPVHILLPHRLVPRESTDRSGGKIPGKISKPKGKRKKKG